VKRTLSMVYAEPVGLHDRLLGARAGAAGRHCHRDGPQLCGKSLAHALGAMARDGVRDLVPHHHRKSGLVARHRQQSRVHGNLAARQRESVDRLRRVDDGELPLVFGFVGDPGNAFTDAADDGVDLGIAIDLLLAEDLLVGLRPEREVLGLGDHHQAAALRVRHGRARAERHRRDSGGDRTPRASAEAEKVAHGGMDHGTDDRKIEASKTGRRDKGGGSV